MENIVKETLEDIGDLGYTEEDIKWVGSYDGKYAMSWGEFKEKFKRLVYDCGYGGQEISKDLVVVGDDWWLEREEYDGAERWEYKKMPTLGERPKAFDKITGQSWRTVEEHNAEEEDDDEEDDDDYMPTNYEINELTDIGYGG